MPEMKVLVRAATLSQESPDKPGRRYPLDLIEFTHGVASIYFANSPTSFSRYSRVDAKSLGEYEKRLDRAGARRMHLTPEESEEVRNIIFGTRDDEKISRFVALMNKRIEQAGLKGDETKRGEGIRKGDLFTKT